MFILSQVSFPMELHLVHFNSKYGDNIGDAIANGGGAQDTLAVLGIMFQLHNKPGRAKKRRYKELQVALLVLMMVAAFLICWMPYGVITLFYFFGGEG